MTRVNDSFHAFLIGKYLHRFQCTTTSTTSGACVHVPVCARARVCVVSFFKSAPTVSSYHDIFLYTGSFRDIETGRQKLQSGIGPVSSLRVQKPAVSDLGSFLMIYRNGSLEFGRFLSLCAASRMWIRYRSLVIFPQEGGLEFSAGLTNKIAFYSCHA